ncbi:MAG: metallophosphoesterase [Halolamina sp.]
MTDTPVDRDGVGSGSVMARLARPRAADRTRIAVIGDPHLSTRAEGTSKLFEDTVTHVENAVADINERDADLTLCVGDITKDGEPWNFDAFDDVAADLETPFRSIPGNHDVPKEGYDHENLPLSAFVDRYTPGELPFHEEVGGVDLIGLNTAGSEEFLTDSHDGLVTDNQLDWLRETLPETETPVVAAHHNLREMSDQLYAHRDAVEPDMHIPPEMRNAEAFREVLTAHDVPLLLTGHLHMPSAAVAGPTRELMAPTTCSFPQGYLLVDVGPEGTEVRFVPVADHAGLRKGFSERAGDSVTARGLTAMAATRLAQFPLVEER